MNYEMVLNQLEKNELTIEEAYNKIYKPKKTKLGKRAFFVKMKIHVPEEGRGINTFLRILFAIPIPIVLARIGLSIGNRFAKLDDDMDLKEISKILKYSKNTIINVDTEEAQIEIKVI